MNFGHLEVLHSKFHDPTISNLGDQSGQTNKETNKETNKQTKRQTDNANYYVDSVGMSLGYSHFSQPPLYAESCGLEWVIFSSDPNWHMNFEILAFVLRVLSSLN